MPVLSAKLASSSSSTSSAPQALRMEWSKLPQDLMANIFNRVPLPDRLVSLPRVCKAWRRVLLEEGACWEVLDLDPMADSCVVLPSLGHFIDLPLPQSHDPAATPTLADALLKRSQGRLREFKLGMCSEHILSLLARREYAQNIQALLIPDLPDYTSEECLQKIPPSMPHLTRLDISGFPMSRQTLEAFGKNCASITWLEVSQMGYFRRSKDLSLVIGKYFSRLKHLVLQSNKLTREGLGCILDNCNDLEWLDLSGCCGVMLDRDLLQRCQNKAMEFRPPGSYYFEDKAGDVEYEVVRD